jgi:5'-nucleotidase
VLLNVNVPSGPRKDIKGVRVTRLGRREYKDELIRRKDPFGRDYYWIGGGPPGGEGEPGTDLHAVADHYVSVTPVQLDLTNHDLIEHVASWRLKL